MSARVALPAVLQEIGEVAGFDIAWKLARARGGTTVFLPKRASHRHWLTAIVGFEAANKICRHFRSNHQLRVTIPLAAAAQKLERWREEIASEASLPESALRMQTTERTVSNWRRRLKMNRQKGGANQGDLF